jgi:type I restriction-modification system DNA methylase subunit
MPAPKEILHLIERFERNIESYRSGEYKETQLRLEFINPFFKILGWDVDNEKGYAEAYKDVIHEDAIKIGGATKAPDYCFRIGGARKFFLEAKKPSVNLKDETNPAFQLRRYAWSAKLPLSILTDFEEFAVYDCRIKPSKNDKAGTSRILYLTYKDYTEKWEEIYSIFSHEAVLKGSFDKFAETTKGKKGTAEVDDAFLKEIESWREILAKDIASNNSKLSQRELNFSVQRIIDRIIFLRICEDRGVEDYGQLMALLNGTRIYPRLKEIFYNADEKYNSGLFHFQKEKDRKEEPDELTLDLKIDDKPLKEIIKNLYYPDSPYEFSVLPADILGQVYEQFLGKVIRLTEGHHAKVEYKPEVKKAGGIYYTPTYIVEYIVKNTVGKLLEGKNPKQVAKLKILDPACGSGSFLIGAYQYLLNWHRDYYVNNGIEKHTKELYEGSGGDFRLTTQEKKRILLSNIYGVDIDTQAVEVTKLSLLLKVLEGENEQTISKQLRIFHERALPDLGNNIKCGNSLIGSDFYNDKQMTLLTEEERYKINVFDWDKEFLEIMRSGGFDAVIGNPPWTFTKYVDWGEATKDYIQKVFLSEREEIGKSKARQSGKINMFAMFILKGANLLRNSGLFGFIVPNNILRTTVYDIVRKQILESYRIKRVVDLKAGVFYGVTASTVILLLESEKPTKKDKIEVIDNKLLGNVEDKIIGYISQNDCLNNPSYVIDIFTDSSSKSLIKKIDKSSTRLGEIVDVLNGIATYGNKEGILDKKKDKDSKPILFGRDISRYYFNYSGMYVDYVREKLLRARDESIFLSKEKLIMQRIGGILITAYDDKQYYTFNSVNNLILKGKVNYNLKYILGIINSKLMCSYYVIRFTNKSTLTVNISKTFLDQLPIYTIDFSNSVEKSKHDKIVELVENILELHKQLRKVKTPDEKTFIQRQIDATDKQIDKLVYELYGLAEEEIKIVESSVK